jgi:hypothetical protein
MSKPNSAKTAPKSSLILAKETVRSLRVRSTVAAGYPGGPPPISEACPHFTTFGC